eukprot:scaffold243164_cov36-Attheya_sp.AAC.1
MMNESNQDIMHRLYQAELDPHYILAVNVPVKQDDIDLVCMYEIKAFLKVQEIHKTWVVVLNIMPSNLPFIVENFQAFLRSAPTQKKKCCTLRYKLAF